MYAPALHALQHARSSITDGKCPRMVVGVPTSIPFTKVHVPSSSALPFARRTVAEKMAPTTASLVRVAMLIATREPVCVLIATEPPSDTGHNGELCFAQL